MSGVLVEIEPGTVRFVATDGHRLVKIAHPQDTGSEKTEKIIIPSRVLNIVDKLITEEDVQISVDTENQRICFETNETMLVASLISESYPNYEAVIPLDNEKKLRVNRANLLSTVKRISRFSSRGDVRLNIEPNQVNVSAENIDEGASADETITCEYSDEAMMIGFNSKFLEESLAHIDTEEIDFEFSSPTRAAIIKPIHEKDTEDDILMLIMPVRINV
jgi:DNA polymerase-3 subunit beta